MSNKSIIKIKEIIQPVLKKKWLALVAVLVLGILIGKLTTSNSTDPTEVESYEHEVVKKQTWTCSMHPQIKQEKPGQCPICGMDLIPLQSSDDESLSLSEIRMSESAMKIAQVQTTIIQKNSPFKEVYFPGKIQPDERNIVELTARYGGRIEKLYINFTGQKVSKGQKLASIYSPDLITAQRELFEAVKYKEQNSAFYKASRNKLKLWDLTENQINQIETSGEPQFYFDVLSPITGTVMQRHKALGDYVKEGDPLFQVINLNHLWVMFEAYENDLPWVKVGDKINFTIKSIPSKVFASTVTFIDPFLNPEKRIVFVRAELNNSGGLLKPEMFASGKLNAMLPNNKDAITVPKTAILWTGKRAIVYVKVPNKEMVFEHREIELGADAGPYFVVRSGLAVGEEVVTNGVFKVDAAAQLLSKQSMMTPAGGKSSTGGHAGMDMGGEKSNKNPGASSESKNQTAKEETVNPTFKKQLGEVVLAYFKMKDALVKDNSSEFSNTLKGMANALTKVDMKLLTNGDQHKIWMTSLEILQAQLGALEGVKDIERQREIFSIISNDLTSTVQIMGADIGAGKIYLDFCPMANDDKGGYWLSSIKEIQNPYFGESMLKCGEIEKILSK